MVELDVLLELLPVGFRFQPTDEELVNHYLKAKLNDSINAADSVDIPEVDDLCKCEPCNLRHISLCLPGISKYPECFFFAPKDPKYPNSHRTMRTTISSSGYWKITAKPKTITTSAPPNLAIGKRNTLTFYSRWDEKKNHSSEKSTRTGWTIHEYRTVEPEFDQGNFVLCHLFEKPVDDRIECNRSSPILTGSSSDAMVTGDDSLHEFTTPPCRENLPFNMDEDDLIPSYSDNLNPELGQNGYSGFSCNSPAFDCWPSTFEYDGENNFASLNNMEIEKPYEFEKPTEVLPPSEAYPIEEMSPMDTMSVVDCNNSAIEALLPQEDLGLEASCQLPGPMRPSSCSMPPPSKSFIGLGVKFYGSMEDDADFDNDETMEAEFMNFFNENGMSASSNASNNLLDEIDHDLSPCGANGGHDETVEMSESGKNAEFGTPTSNRASEKASFGFSDNDDNASSLHAEDAKEPNDFCVKAEGPLQEAPRTGAVYFGRLNVVISVVLCVLCIIIGWFCVFRS